MAVILICDWIVTQPFCLACMEPISVNMEGLPAVGHASPASSVGEADPHLVSVFHIACMPFLSPPPPPPNTFWWLSADCVLMWGRWGVGWKSEHSFYISPLPCYCSFYPLSPEKRCIDLKKKTIQGDASFKKLLWTERRSKYSLKHPDQSLCWMKMASLVD